MSIQQKELLINVVAVIIAVGLFLTLRDHLIIAFAILMGLIVILAVIRKSLHKNSK